MTVSAPAPTTVFTPGTRLLFFAPFLVFVIHTVEEIPDFAAWVSTHFAPLSTYKFTTTHIPLMLLVLLASWKAARPNASTSWVVLAVAFQWQFAVNALFHLGTTIGFGDYSPGLVTASVVALPVTTAFFVKIIRERVLSRRRLLAAIGIGTAVAAAAIGVLFLD